jgi:glycerol-3-phosphate O-acyltransferase
MHTPVSHTWLAPCAMHPRRSWVWRTFFQPLFKSVPYPDTAVETIQSLHSQGELVYLARGHSSWIPFYFNHVFQHHALPLATCVLGVSYFLFQPLKHVLVFLNQRLFMRRPSLYRGIDKKAFTRPEWYLATHVSAGNPAFIVVSPRAEKKQETLSTDYLRTLVRIQKNHTRPIFLLPHVLSDRSQGGSAYASVADRILGDRRRPTRLRYWIWLMSPIHRLTVRMAPPVNIREFIAQHPEDDETLLLRRLRFELNKSMQAEERVVAGPEMPSLESTTRHVLRNPHVKQAIQETALKTGKKTSSLEKQATHQLKQIAARYNVHYIEFLANLLHGVFHRIYDGISIDQPGLQKAIEASRKGPIIYCPCHRSHMDYLVLSYILWQQGVAPPHIAAGANLSFFPLGPIFRGSGAFFLRRSFRDDAVYGAVFRAYVHELVKTGASIEFFLEGTRSRTGKLLMPKFGILSMVVDAWRQGAREDIQFVPVSIDYERIIESGSYSKELRGQEKKSEDIGGLLRSTKVLQSRYGQVHVQFGDPISLQHMAQERHLPRSEDPSHNHLWRDEVTRLGYHILHKVAMVCSVTPTSIVATALLTHTGRGIPQGVLLERCKVIVAYLQNRQARLSHLIENPTSRVSAILEVLQKWTHENLIAVEQAGRNDIEPIYRVPEEKRILLDFHKNALMNYFAPAALVARALMHSPAQPVPLQEARENSLFLSRLFKREFIFNVGPQFHTQFDETLHGLQQEGLIHIENNTHIQIIDQETISMLASLLHSFIQGYYITSTVLLDLRAFPLWQKEVVTRSLERARRAFLEGSITCPESANRTLIESSLQWMLKEGVLETSSEGKKATLKLTEAYAGEHLQKLVDRIGSFL